VLSCKAYPLPRRQLLLFAAASSVPLNLLVDGVVRGFDAAVKTRLGVEVEGEGGIAGEGLLDMVRSSWIKRLLLVGP
jgi:hypothetical protein